MSRSRALGLRLALAVVSVAVALVLAEAVLRLTSPAAGSPVDSGLPAKTTLDYGDTWREGGLGPGGYLQEGYSADVNDGLGGTVRWKNNAQGFRRDDDTALEPPSGGLRVLSLGDSFTGGYRVDQEDTFSRRLETWLQDRQPDRDVEVLISVIEEPVTGLYYLATEGRHYRPDLVLLGITLGNDLAQTYLNLDPDGDFRRTEDPSIPIEQNPNAQEAAVVARMKSLSIPVTCVDPQSHLPRSNASEPALHLERLARRIARRWAPAGEAVTSTWPDAFPPRLFDGNGLGFFLTEPTPEIDVAFHRLDSVLRGYRDLAREIGADFAVVLFPQRYQVQPRDWQAMVESHALAANCFDLEAANRRILEICQQDSIACFDPTPGMAEQSRLSGALYFPNGDMHWNAEGHRVLYELIREWVGGLSLRAASRPVG